jgi:hypothetical protein
MRNVEGYGNYDPPHERLTLVPKRSEGAPTGPVTAPPTPLTSNQLQPSGVNTKPHKTSKKSAKVAKPALLAGGHPQIAKADGDAPVQAYIGAMPDRKRDVERRLEALRFSSLVPRL